jgi:lipopolysaccharide export system protein LptA
MAATLLLASAQAYGQGIGLPGQTRETPIEIFADEGIEWQQKSQAYIARVNARAVQGDVTIFGDVLIAYYSKGPEGGTEIWRIDAIGNVRIVSPEQTAYGAKAVYGVESGVLVLTGKPLLVTKTDKITARDSLEFWEKQSMAIARGNAIAIREDKRIRADVLTAYFAKGKSGKSEIQRIHAYNNVLVSSPTEIVRANKGVYNVKTGIVVATGSVRITRGQDQLNGQAAEINMNTGVTRMLSSGAGRVHGIFQPKSARGKAARKGRKKSARPGRKKGKTTR